MPYDIEMNTEIPKIQVLFSKTVESITALQLLSDSKHHEFAREWANNMYDILSNESMHLLHLISNMNLQGLEFLEFILENKIYHDVDKLINTILDYDEIEFIYKTTGEKLNYDEIITLKNDKSKFSLLKKNKPWLVRGNFEVIEFIIYETVNFKRQLANLLKEINNNFIIASRAYFLQSPTCTRFNNLDYTVMILTPMESWC